MSRPRSNPLRNAKALRRRRMRNRMARASRRRNRLFA